MVGVQGDLDIGLQGALVVGLQRGYDPPEYIGRRGGSLPSCVRRGGRPENPGPAELGRTRGDPDGAAGRKADRI